MISQGHLAYLYPRRDAALGPEPLVSGIHLRALKSLALWNQNQAARVTVMFYVQHGGGGPN